MAEFPSKRLREESHLEFDGSGANSKRQKPYNNILNLLDEEEEEEAEPSQEPSHELSQDLSAIFTIFQQELSSSTTTTTTTTTTFDFDSLPRTAAVEEAEQFPHQDSSAGGDEDEGVKSVMRHLLEASDDELGIPNTRDDENNFGILNSGENFPLDNGLWELEDEAANYYTVLQAELFM